MLVGLLLSIASTGTALSSVGLNNAVYTISNDFLQNGIVSINEYDNGTLAQGSTLVTGGKGGNWIRSDNTSETGADSLVSKGPLVVVDNYLFAINAGSNTVSLFLIDWLALDNLTLIGNPVATGGEFPVALAVAPIRQLICVANLGAMDGIACAGYTKLGIGKFDAIRPFHRGQKTPPNIAYSRAVPQLFFNQEESALFAILNENALHSSMLTYNILEMADVDRKAPQVAPVPLVASLPFYGFAGGVAPLPVINIIVLACSQGAIGVFLYPTNGSAIPFQNRPTGGASYSDVLYSETRGSILALRAGGMTLDEMDPMTGDVLGSFTSTNKQNPKLPGLSYYSLATIGSNLYALVTTSGNNGATLGIGVIDITVGHPLTDLQFFAFPKTMANAVGLVPYCTSFYCGVGVSPNRE